MMIRSLQAIGSLCLFLSVVSVPGKAEDVPAHPRLMADQTEIDSAKRWMGDYPWYRGIIEQRKADIDRFIDHGPIFVSPIKQTYQFEMYTCPRHHVELMYEEFRPHEHRCPVDTTEVYSGGKYDAAWAGWYNRLLADHLVWMGILYNLYGNDKYAAAGREILVKFADLYLKYPTENTILGPAHVFFGTLSESFWGVDMACGYDYLYNYPGFTPDDRAAIKEKLFIPLAQITQQFPESASNRQLWYNDVSAAVGFLYDEKDLIDFALNGRFGFTWQLGSALPESGLWPEWTGYHFVALRGMVYLAEMARHNGIDLYHEKISGRTLKVMFDAPLLLFKPNFEFPRNKDSGGGNILEYAAYYEIGYAAYRDPRYLAILNETSLKRGAQVVGETSAAGRDFTPISIFNIVPRLPKDTSDIYDYESVNFAGTGYAVLRNGRGTDRRYLYLDYGIMGGEHGHPDRLQIGYYANGRNWIVDPLNESYMNPNLQLWYRQSIAHNTPVIDQTTQTWTNGYGNFFGALPRFQVASGACSTAYPGVTITRTLLQVGDYFVDITDVNAPEERIIDWPLHGFGTVRVDGPRLAPQPVDLFGNKPGIPGYDQLTDIFEGKTDSSWTALFTDGDAHLQIRAIGEKGTEVFTAMTPPIGGFYKQMVKEQVPEPMIMTRRRAANTRFVHLVEAWDNFPRVTGIHRGSGPGMYIVDRNHNRDVLLADVARSRYWAFRTLYGGPIFLAGFNVDSLQYNGIRYLSAPYPLRRFQCFWDGDSLKVITDENFFEVSVYAPQARVVTLNGRFLPFVRSGDDVMIRQPGGIAIRENAAMDSILYAGLISTLKVSVWNASDTAATGKVSIALDGDWKEHVTGQMHWWGGIVNLFATNKGPIQRVTEPANYPVDDSWINGVSSVTGTIPPHGHRDFDVVVRVPNDAPRVTFPGALHFLNSSERASFVVRPPLSADILMPDNQKEQLWVDVRNESPVARTVTAELFPDPAWHTDRHIKTTLSLPPFGTRRLPVHLRLTGYTSENQKYPVRLELKTGEFREEITRDMYAGIAHYAARPPSLDGSWSGWDTSRPFTIDSKTQACKLLFGNQPWGGLRDLSARVSVMYDANFIYVGANITDDSVVSHWDFPRMSYPWDTDCMEIVVDTRTNSTQGHDPPTPGLYRHLSLDEYRHTDFSAEAWRGGGAGGPLLPKPNLFPGAETFFHRTATGYVLVTRLPIACMKSVIARPGYKLGFDVGINDNDGTNYRKNLYIWAGYTQNQSWWDMGTIGAIIFGPAR